MITDVLRINEREFNKIVTQDFITRKVCTKMVPKILNDYRKAGRYDMSAEMTERLETEPDFLTRVMTCDESWVFEYDPENKWQSEECHTPQSPREKKLA